MRKWVELEDNLVYVKFLADTAQKEKQLDELLFQGEKSFPISGEKDKTVEQGAKPLAEMGGHEKMRWIIIPLVVARDRRIQIRLKGISKGDY